MWNELTVSEELYLKKFASHFFEVYMLMAWKSNESDFSEQDDHILFGFPCEFMDEKKYEFVVRKIFIFQIIQLCKKKIIHINIEDLLSLPLRHLSDYWIQNSCSEEGEVIETLAQRLFEAYGYHYIEKDIDVSDFIYSFAEKRHDAERMEIEYFENRETGEFKDMYEILTDMYAEDISDKMEYEERQLLDNGDFMTDIMRMSWSNPSVRDTVTMYAIENPVLSKFVRKADSALTLSEDEYQIYKFYEMIKYFLCKEYNTGFFENDYTGKDTSPVYCGAIVWKLLQTDENENCIDESDDFYLYFNLAYFFIIPVLDKWLYYANI